MATTTTTPTYTINSTITYYTHSINGARTVTGTITSISGQSLTVEHDGCAHRVPMWDVVR